MGNLRVRLDHLEQRYTRAQGGRPDVIIVRVQVDGEGPGRIINVREYLAQQKEQVGPGAAKEERRPAGQE